MNISEEAVDRIRKINKIGIELEGGKEERMLYDLGSIKKHAEEINKLFSRDDEHWALETGDLMIHCMRMLLLHDFDLNSMFDKCCDRFEEKISKKLEERSQK